jgi:hypothetical protein
MVEDIKNIISKYPKQQKTDVEILVAYARNKPNEDLPFLLLQNYPPDLFNSDLWNKADQISAKYKGLLTDSNAINANTFEPELVLKNVSLTEQWAIIDAFLAKKLPDFI